jgi:acylglycerol lipase
VSRRLVASILVALALAACAGAGPELPVEPKPLAPHAWLPDGEPRAVVLALHGFNDYGHGFDMLGRFAAEEGIAVHAYDQRSFGRNPDRGVWPGPETLVEDARARIEELQREHPDVPLFLVGESMGAAVLLLLLSEPEPPDVAGTVLSAPAVWGDDQMNDLMRLGLQIAATLFPGLTVRATGDAFNVRASDNDEALRALGEDPLVIKTTRLDSVLGVVELMDAAMARAERVQGTVLALGGENDEVIPPRAFLALVDRLGAEDCTAVMYPDGWHLLLRDLQREVVYEDILAWIEGEPLPSGLAAPCGAPDA